MVKLKIWFAATGAFAAFASGAHAVNVGLAANETGYVDGRHVDIDPLTLDGKIWFCISPDLDIQTGQQTYDYTPSSLTPANSQSVTEYTLTNAQIGEIGALVDKGTADFNNHASGVQLAADASAIWSVEGATVTADNATVTPLIQADLSYAASHSAHFTTMTNTSGVQNVGGVPEPASWALMIVGFGLAGGVARRRRLVGASLQGAARV